MDIFVDRWRWTEGAAAGLAARDFVLRVGEAERARRPLASLVAVASSPGAGEVPVGAKWLVDGDGALLGLTPPGLRERLRELGAEAFASGGRRVVWLKPSAPGWERASEEGTGLGVFVELLGPPAELLIVGAGHIALPLAQIGALLDFEVTVLDDRAAFASGDRFPAAEVLVGPIDAVLAGRSIGPSTYVVLVTRGHQHDETALRSVIASDAAYIGMIGSRRRVKEVFRHLHAAGVTASLIERVHAPIGLRIGAQTPAEIAVAIAAELVQVRRAVSLAAGRATATR
jgi:xanthine dehydrogenase accessory factor